MNDIYVSSIAFRGMDITDMILLAEENKFAVEFSSGMNYMIGMEQIYLNATIKRMAHNYFPAPEIPFVLNLASKDLGIRNLSIKHCKEGLILSKKSNSPFFAAHAGFCIDPSPKDLGREFVFSNNYNRDENKKLFLESLLDILNLANELEIDFLFENNVLAPFNFKGDVDPFLCCDSSDINFVFNNIQDKRLGLLLDTGHLKVTCQTFGKKINEELMSIKNYIKGIHHSDNDGSQDTNSRIKNDYWFLEHLKNYCNIPNVLEVKELSVFEISEQIKILQSVWN